MESTSYKCYSFNMKRVPLCNPYSADKFNRQAHSHTRRQDNVGGFDSPPPTSYALFMHSASFLPIRCRKLESLILRGRISFFIYGGKIDYVCVRVWIAVRLKNA